jgi:hypothetical protein
MSDNNGWPGKPGVPLNPERDGWHWLVQKNAQFPEVWEWNAGPLGAVAEYGDQSIGAWLEGEGNGQPKEMAKWYRYLGPALTPAEVVARIATARREGMEQAAQIADNYANRNHVSLNIAAAIRAAAEKGK